MKPSAPDMNTDRPLSGLGQRSEPMASLYQLARLLGATVANRTFQSLPGLPGPELLADLALRLGVVFEFRHFNVAKLDERDCPCVVILKDGSGRLVVAAENAASLVIENGDGTSISVARNDLAAAATGVVYCGELKGATRGELESDAAIASGAGFETVQEGSGIVRHLRQVFIEKRRLIFSLAVAGTLSSLITLAVPMFTMVVFDRVIPHGAFETLWALLIGCTLLLAMDYGLRHVRHMLLDAIAVNTATDLGARFYSRLLHAPLSVLPRNPGELVQPYQEMNQLAYLAPQFLAALIVDIPFLLAITIVLWALGGPMALVPLLGIITLLLAHTIAHVRMQRHIGEEALLSRRLTQMIIDAVGVAETVRTTGAGRSLLMQWEGRNDAVAMAGHQLRTEQGMTTHLSAVVVQLVTIISVALGAIAVSSSTMTVGALSACIMLSGRSVLPMAMLFSQGFRIAQLLRSTSQAVALISTEPERGLDTSRLGGSAITGRVQLSRARFMYAGTTSPALQDVSLTIAAGERVGIVGKSGCGKSTLLRLLARLHELGEGQLHLDGRDIRQIDPLLLRQAVALLPQNPQLFDASLEANMTMGLTTPDTSWLTRVATITGVTDFASRNPAGFSLDAGPGGSRLSGGERQAVALARALMGQPRLLLLDEPTAAMDNEREAEIVRQLLIELAPDGGSPLAGTGLVVATHRLPILALVDRVIWLEGGRVVADGPKAEMFRRFGLAA